MLPRLAVAVLASLALGGCGNEAQTSGGQGQTEPRPDPAADERGKAETSEQRTRPDAVAGLDVREVGKARDRLIAICRRRDESPASRAGSTAELREVTSTLISAFRRNPDERFRRSAGIPAVTMRELLASVAVVARRRCGDGAGVAAANRMREALASRKPKSQADGGRD